MPISPSSALSELAKLAATCTRSANWLDPNAPLRPFTGRGGHNNVISWHVWADHVEVLQLASPRAGIMKTTARISITAGHARTVPDDVQQLLVSYVQQLPRMDFAQAKAAAEVVARKAPMLNLRVEEGAEHAPRRVPTQKFDLKTGDGFLTSTPIRFSLTITSPHPQGQMNTTEFTNESRMARLALGWVAEHESEIPHMTGAQILAELRKLGFRGQST